MHPSFLHLLSAHSCCTYNIMLPCLIKMWLYIYFFFTPFVHGYLTKGCSMTIALLLCLQDQVEGLMHQAADEAG